MTEADWSSRTDPQAMLEFLRASGNLSQRKARLFAVACCRRLWHLLEDKGSREAVETAERYAEGEASDRELTTARNVAFMATRALDRSVGLYDAHAVNLARVADTVCCQPAADIAQAAAEQTANSHDGDRARRRKRARQAALLRDIFGPLPFRSVTVFPSVRTWNDATVVRLAQAAYEQRSLPAGTLDNARLAVLADALEEAGCTDAELLAHLRSPGAHVRGCHAVDAILGRD
jgi:hypothetical protein